MYNQHKNIIVAYITMTKIDLSNCRIIRSNKVSIIRHAINTLVKGSEHIRTVGYVSSQHGRLISQNELISTICVAIKR